MTRAAPRQSYRGPASAAVAQRVLRRAKNAGTNNGPKDTGAIAAAPRRYGRRAHNERDERRPLAQRGLARGPSLGAASAAAQVRALPATLTEEPRLTRRPGGSGALNYKSLFSANAICNFEPSIALMHFPDPRFSAPRVLLVFYR